MRVAVLAAVIGIAAGPAAAAPASRPAPGCAAFMDSFVRAALPRRTSFERPLTITRGFSGDEPGVEVRTLTTGDDVEGTLKCRGDGFRRFEIRVAAPPAEGPTADFRALEEAGLAAAFGWDRAKVATVITAMSADAAEYLRASAQRGDTVVAGKVEYHQGEVLDLGVLWTEDDRTFVITSQADE